MTEERLVKLWNQLLQPGQFIGDGCCPQVVAQVESLFPPVNEFKKVCDIGCFTKGTKILMKDYSQKEINNIIEGEEIITHKDKSRKVIKTFERNYNGEMFKITTPYFISIDCTPEHPILGIKHKNIVCNNGRKQICNTDKEQKCTTCGKIKYSNPEFIEAKELRSRDYIAIPRTEIGSIVLNELATLCGWYLAEGSVLYSHRPKIGGLIFSLNFNEDEFAQEIKKNAEILGATSVTIKKRKEKSIQEVFVYGKNLAETIVNLCGKGCSTKKLNEEIFKWDKDSLTNLLQSWFLGDGHYRKSLNRGEQYTCKTISENLSIQCRILFQKLGILPSICHFDPKDKRHKRTYSITLSGTDINLLIKEKVKYSSKKRYRITKDYIFVPIINIIKYNFNGKVYNLNVEEDNSYVANNICVHNCGDGYWIKKLKEKGYKTTGLDLCYENKELDIIKGDMHFTPYQDNEFDWIFCNQTWEHTIAPVILTIELNRITKLNGFVFLTIPSENSQWVYDAQHYAVLPKQCVENIFLKCGFQLIKYSRVSERPSNSENDVMQVFLFRKEVEIKNANK